MPTRNPSRRRVTSDPGRRLGTLGLLLAGTLLGSPATSDEARIVVDATRVEGRIDPRLYGQFAEFMYEGVKGGLSAEMVRNRGFEEPANHLGLSRHWERYPDDRIHDYGMSLAWDDSVALSRRARPLRRQAGPALASRGPGRGHRRAARGLPAPHPGGGGCRLPRVPLAEDDRLRRTHPRGPGGGRDRREDVCRGGDPGRPGRLEAVPVRAPPGPGRLPTPGWPSSSRGADACGSTRCRSCRADAAAGVRSDVETLVAALRPAFIRWPGGNVAQDYHWAWGTGPRDRRPVWTNLSWKQRAGAGRHRHGRVRGLLSSRRSGAVDHRERGGTGRDGGRGRGMGRVLQRPRHLALRRDARRQRAP